MKEIFSRRSVRRFTDEKPDREEIERLLRAAMCAPSAGNQRPWEFIVVEQKELLCRLADFSPYAKPLLGAQTAIVVLGNPERMRFPENWEQDLGACCENLWLEATHIGLGTVWLGCAPLKERMDKVRDILGLAPTLLPYAVFPIGRAAETPADRENWEPARVRFL